MPATADEAWRAVTEPARVERWLGALSGELKQGARVRLDFEDGDFFDLEVEAVTEPVVRWAWRFMGCGPRDAIELGVEPDGNAASCVTVTDHEPNRSPDEALALGDGWRDFLERLQRHLATGDRTRFDWRRGVDVWVELPVDAGAARRLVIGSAAVWLPLERGAASLMAAEALVLDDRAAPSRFRIDGVEGTGPASVRFELLPYGIDGSLPTEIAVAARGDGALLSISQTGFGDLAAGDATQRSIRERFAKAWLASARRARDLAERGPVHGAVVAAT